MNTRVHLRALKQAEYIANDYEHLYNAVDTLNKG